MYLCDALTVKGPAKKPLPSSYRVCYGEKILTDNQFV